MDNKKMIFNPVELMESYDRDSPQLAYQDLGRCPYVRPDTGVHVFATRQEIVEFNRHPATRTTDGSHWTMGAQSALIPLDLDGDEHRRFRALLEPLFTPKAVAGLEPAIRSLTDELVDGFIGQGEVDLFSQFCERLPAMIFISLLGLPQSQLPVFLRFKDDVIRPEGDTADERLAYKEAAGAKMDAYINGVLDEREASGELGDDLIGGFLRAEVDGKKLSRVEISSIIYLLIVAGLDTVASSLSCIFAWLAKNPAQRHRIVADPTLLPHAIEELLRFESPVPHGTRHVIEDAVIKGRSLKAGDVVEVVWAAADVDPEAFEDPLAVNIERRRNAHLVFASGPHRCLGSNLARMELRAAVDQFHKRIPDYWPIPEKPIVYTNEGVRGAVQLPISFTARDDG